MKGVRDGGFFPCSMMYAICLCLCACVCLGCRAGGNSAFLTGISHLAQSLQASGVSAWSHSFSHLGQPRVMKFGGILPAPPTQNATQRLRL